MCVCVCVGVWRLEDIPGVNAADPTSTGGEREAVCVCVCETGQTEPPPCPVSCPQSVPMGLPVEGNIRASLFYGDLRSH